MLGVREMLRCDAKRRWEPRRERIEMLQYRQISNLFPKTIKKWSAKCESTSSIYASTKYRYIRSGEYLLSITVCTLQEYVVWSFSEQFCVNTFNELVRESSQPNSFDHPLLFLRMS